MFRFDGALDTYGHILDVFVRRFFPAGEGKVCEQLAIFLVESQVFQTLNKEEDFAMTSKVFTQVPAFITQLAIPSQAGTSKKKAFSEPL
jgi:hypothetical protein